MLSCSGAEQPVRQAGGERRAWVSCSGCTLVGGMGTPGKRTVLPSRKLVSAIIDRTVSPG